MNIRSYDIDLNPDLLNELKILLGKFENNVRDYRDYTFKMKNQFDLMF